MKRGRGKEASAEAAAGEPDPSAKARRVSERTRAGGRTHLPEAKSAGPTGATRTSKPGAARKSRAAQKSGGAGDSAEEAPEASKASSPAPASAPGEVTQGASSAAPVVLFAHGAGAGSSHPWMVKWKKLLETGTGAEAVIAFDYPYLSGGQRKAPPKAEKLVDFHLAQVKAAREKYPGHPIILCGKSMGSRVGAMVASQKDAHVSGVICLGYPIRGINGASRAQTLQDVPCPVLLVQGSKDSLGPLNEIKAAIGRMKPGQATLHVVDGGDHSLNVSAKALKGQGKTQDAVDLECIQVIKNFMSELATGA